MLPSHHRPANSSGHILPVATSQRRETRSYGSGFDFAQQGSQRHADDALPEVADSLRRETAALAEGTQGNRRVLPYIHTYIHAALLL